MRLKTAALGLLAAAALILPPASAHAAARIPDTRLEFGVGQIHPCQPGGNCYPQGALQARHHAVGVDGMFGPVTAAAVRAVQIGAGLVADGVVGPQTWPVLLGIA